MKHYFDGILRKIYKPSEKFLSRAQIRICQNAPPQTHAKRGRKTHADSQKTKYENYRSANNFTLLVNAIILLHNHQMSQRAANKEMQFAIQCGPQFHMIFDVNQSFVIKNNLQEIIFLEKFSDHDLVLVSITKESTGAYQEQF